jgi:hypothetical protein
MPEANSAPFQSTPVGRYPQTSPEPPQKPKLLDRLREADIVVRVWFAPNKALNPDARNDGAPRLA